MSEKDRNDLILKIAEYGYYKQLQGLGKDNGDFCHERFKEIQRIINGTEKNI